MQRWFLGFAALSGFLSASLGAFAAHGLKSYLDSDELALWQTGVQYQIYHSLALLAVGILYQQYPATPLKLSGSAFILGILLFPSSLYLLALGFPRAVGIMTPFGGLSFLIGWLALFTAVWCRPRP